MIQGKIFTSDLLEMSATVRHCTLLLRTHYLRSIGSVMSNLQQHKSSDQSPSLDTSVPRKVFGVVEYERVTFQLTRRTMLHHLLANRLTDLSKRRRRHKRTRVCSFPWQYCSFLADKLIDPQTQLGRNAHEVWRFAWVCCGHGSLMHWMWSNARVGMQKDIVCSMPFQLLIRIALRRFQKDRLR